jgi:hypothetical protein
MNKNTIASLLFTVGCALQLWTLPAARAQDGKVYPGSNCHPLSPANADIMSYGFNYVENTSTTYSLLVICPGIKDNVASVTGLSLISVRYDKPSSTGFFCSIYSKSSIGSGGYTSSQWDFDFAGNGKSMSLAAVSSYNAGSYQMYCILPPKVGSTTAKLHTYRLDEN